MVKHYLNPRRCYIIILEGKEAAVDPEQGVGE